ncbi:hypothetical protein [Burkholderia plantarii]|uniref:hypothetical protein n=1 Tax=Burkholderia plantarii TaxID=41899 RepID=UPI00209AFA88|nr:hypothetical protein [Burkholderia plantarii]
MVEAHLALHAHAELLVAALEFPRMRAAVGRQAQVDAAMPGQVVGRGRHGAPRQLVGRARHRHPQIGRDAHGDHVLRHLIAEAHAGVEALRGDVGQPVATLDSMWTSGWRFGKGSSRGHGTVLMA